MENLEEKQAMQAEKSTKKRNIIETLFSRGETKLEKMFSPREIISAKTAYMKTRYGRELTQTDLLHDFMLKCRHMIDVRIAEGHYMGTIEIADDVMDFLPKLKKYYEDNGYKAVILSPTTRIYDETADGNQTLVDVRINATILMLLWGDVQISDTVSANDQQTQGKEA